MSVVKYAIRTAALVLALAALTQGSYAPPTTELRIVQSETPTADSSFMPGELLVRFKPAATHGKSVISPRGTLIERFSHLDIEHWRLAPGVDVRAEIARLTATGQVEFAEPNYRRAAAAVSSNPSYANSWSFVHDIGLDSAWNDAVTNPVVVAVIDDAIDIDHPDLSNHIWTNAAEDGGVDGSDDDKNGYPDDIHGWAFGNGYAPEQSNNVRPDPSACEGSNDQGQGHGTEVAGVLAGVASSIDLRIMPLKMGCGSYNVATVAEAIEYAVANGADIVNLSYAAADGTYSNTEKAAIDHLETAGILYVTSAGNYHGNNDNVPMYPANQPNVNVVSVAASDGNALTHWSHWGPLSVDLAAPGVDIETTALNYGYTTVSGTSLSSPIVAGVAALLKAHDSSATIYDLKGALMAGVDPLMVNDSVPLEGRLASDGRVNANSTLTALTNPRPVLVINELMVDDSLDNNNGLLDPGETVGLNITLENVWSDASAVQATLTNNDNLVSILPAEPNDYGAMAKGTTATKPFTLSLSSSAPAHKRIPFTLTIQADAWIFTRHFALEIGQLQNEAIVDEVIQKDAFDEFHNYHIAVPSGATKLVFEVDYTKSARDVDVIAKYGAAPLLLFDGNGGLTYKNSSYVSKGTVGFERLELAGGLTPGTYYATVFSTPKTVTGTDYTANVPYHIRACYTMADDTNQSPQVAIGGDELITVDGGQTLNLNVTTLNDPDGTITYRWWQQLSGPSVQLSDPRSEIVSFVAPSAASATSPIVLRFSASDDHCVVGSDSVQIAVRNDQPNNTTAPVFAATLASEYSVANSGNLQFSVTATVSGGASATVTANSLPDGASYGQFDGFYWPNAGPPGTYFASFTATGSNGVQATKTITIKVTSGNLYNNGSSVRKAPAGGCSIGADTGFDPALPVLALVSMIVLWRRRAGV